jgi:general secretion pathway protein G
MKWLRRIGFAVFFFIAGFAACILLLCLSVRYGSSVQYLPLPLPPAARSTETYAQLHCVATASRIYRREIGEWPPSLAVLTNNSRGIIFIDWGQKGAHDAWGHPFAYSGFDVGRGYGSVLSYGRDGKLGGEGEDKDVEVRFTEDRMLIPWQVPDTILTNKPSTPGLAPASHTINR